MPGTSIWHTCCSRITPLQPRAAPPGMAVQHGCPAGAGAGARALSASSPRTAPRNVHLTKNRACLEKMYAKGKQDAEALVRWMQNTKQDESVGTYFTSLDNIRPDIIR